MTKFFRREVTLCHWMIRAQDTDDVIKINITTANITEIDHFLIYDGICIFSSRNTVIKTLYYIKPSKYQIKIYRLSVEKIPAVIYQRCNVIILLNDDFHLFW